MVNVCKENMKMCYPEKVLTLYTSILRKITKKTEFKFVFIDSSIFPPPNLTL